MDHAGELVPVLLVAHGSRDLLVRTQGACVAIALIVEVSPATRAQFARLAPRLQGHAFRALQAHLFHQPRTSVALEPPGVSLIAEVERLVVEQVFRISLEDPASFNRLADGLQELVVAAAGAFAKVGALVGAAGDPSPGRRDPPPAGMYA